MDELEDKLEGLDKTIELKHISKGSPWFPDYIPSSDSVKISTLTDALENLVVINIKELDGFEVGIEYLCVGHTDDSFKVANMYGGIVWVEKQYFKMKDLGAQIKVDLQDSYNL